MACQLLIKAGCTRNDLNERLHIRTITMRTLLAAPLLLTALSAQAIPVIGASGGSFSNLSSCDYSGSYRDCRIVSTLNGPDTQVQWGSQSVYTNFVNPSRLTSVDVSINADTDAGGLGVAIARLDWYNSATWRLNSSLDSFAVRWELSLGFSSPSGPDAFGSESFNLNIYNPINPVGDSLYGMGLTDLSGLADSVSLGGASIDNLRYAVVDGAGTGSSSFNNNVWYNSENNWSSLYILADFRSASTSVPEPATLGLFGLGLIGASLASRRRRICKAS